MITKKEFDELPDYERDAEAIKQKIWDNCGIVEELMHQCSILTQESDELEKLLVKINKLG